MMKTELMKPCEGTRGNKFKSECDFSLILIIIGYHYR